MDWKLTAIRYARSVLSEKTVFSGGDPEKKLPISFVPAVRKIAENLLNGMPGISIGSCFAMTRIPIPDVLSEGVHYESNSCG